jgi:ribose transport system permease protein/putative xylitol transport system permease protein
LVGVAIISILTVYTRHGRYLYAIGGGEVVARLSGVKVDRYKILAFALSGTLAGAAGLALTMRASAATPQMGDPFLLTSVAAVVVGGTALLGGIGGPHWTILGALVIITLDDGMIIANVDPDYQTVIRGLVIILASALTLRRQGQVVIK